MLRSAKIDQVAHRAQVGIAIAAALLFAPSAAAAGPGARARLRYQRLPGAESCPAQPAFQAEVAAWLGYDPFSEASPRAVVIDLSGSEAGLEARLRLEDDSGKTLGERHITTGSADCRDLTQALVLAVALAVDPLPITRDVIAPAPPPVVVQAPAPPATKPAPSLPLPEGSRAEVSATLGGSLWVLAGPQPSPGVVAGFEIRWGHFSLGVDGQADAFTGEPWPPSGSIQVSLLAAELLPCYRSGVFGICAVLAVGAEFGHGQGLNEARSEPLPYIGAGGRLLAEFPLVGPLSFRVQLDGVGTALGASFHVGTADVWDTPPVAFDLAAVLGLRL